MSAAQGLSSINCTSCGAGLSVLGGGRVASHTCGYCGAVLDAQNDYKVLYSIGKRNHPASPVQIGQTLTHNGVEFTVIGTLGIKESYGGRTWRWVEHQIYSPTHGYLWLNVEDGNLTFSRKVRDFTMSHWLTPWAIERAETPPKRRYDGAIYRYYETSQTQIEFIEGEFNWVPRLGEGKEVVSLLGPDAMLSLVASKTEREVEITKLLPREEAAKDLGFDPRDLGAPAAHPLAPYRPLREEGFMRITLWMTAVAAVVLGLVFWTWQGETVLETRGMALRDLPAEFDFQVDNTEQLSRLQFLTNFQNGWATLSAEITGPDGTPLVAGARSISFYSGREGGENWSEGSRQDSFRFRAQAPGPHRVRLEVIDPGAIAANSVVQLRVTQGKPTAFWLFVTAGVAGLLAFLLTARRALHEKRRFAGSDWHD